MENFMRQFKTSPLYFWIVLVFWESLKQAIPFTELRGRIMELARSLLVGLFLVIFLGQAGQIPDVGINLYTFAIWLGVTVLFRTLVGSLTVPAKMYFSEKNKADRFNFNNLHFQLIALDKGYGVRVINEKVFDIKSTLMGIMSLDIDNETVFQESFQENTVDQNGKRLPWLKAPMPNNRELLIQNLKKEGGAATVVLVENNAIPVYVYSEKENNYIRRDYYFEREATGDINIICYYGERLGGPPTGEIIYDGYKVYRFRFYADKSKKPMFKEVKYDF